MGQRFIVKGGLCIAVALRYWQEAAESLTTFFSADHEGEVVFELQISASGVIQNQNAIKGTPGLTEFTGRGLRSWKFASALIAGHPVAGTVIVTISLSSPSYGLRI